MNRFVLAGVIAVGLAIVIAIGFDSTARCQDEGRPFGPPTGRPVLKMAWLYNNTDETVQFTSVSGVGGLGGVLRPGEYAQLSFVDNGWTRVLSVASKRDGKIITVRRPVLKGNRIYDVKLPFRMSDKDAPPDEGREGEPPPGSTVNEPKGLGD
jgi:hypothetical protein